MKALTPIPTPWRYKEDFRRIGDLVNFEGPELTVFEHLDSHQVFLFDWVDHDDRQNRWLIMEVLPKDLLEYVYHKITHRVLFQRAMARPVYYLDIDNHKGFSGLPVFGVQAVPEEYQPNEVMFDMADCPDHSRIVAYLQSRISAESQENRLHDQPTLRFWNLLNENHGYPSHPLTHDDRDLSSAAKVDQASTNQLVYTEIRFSSEIKSLIQDNMLPNAKSHGFSNAS